MRVLLVILILLASTFRVAAQEAVLVADTVRIENDDRLIAEGNVQVAYQGSVLTASRVTYDQSTDRIAIEGPLTLDDGGTVTILANSAELNKDLTDGILQSARLVLDRQLQLAATEIARVGGRYTQLANVVTSSCEICATGDTPLWEIRARRVIYDQEEELLYFDRASFRLGGVPIAYIPRLRLPTSNNERQSGLLAPRIVSSSVLGFGIKLPYFQTLGPYADLTLTPYLAGRTRTLEAVYRHNFTTGALTLGGAVSRDDVRPGETRHFLAAEGAFLLPRDVLLSFELNETSDRTYLAQYGYAYPEVLESEVALTRYRRQEAVRATITRYEPLAADEAQVADRLPGAAFDIAYQRRFGVGPGELRLGFDAGGVRRASDEDGLGRDVVEMGSSAEYLSRTVLGSGLVWSNRAFLSGGAYSVTNDPVFGDVFRVAGATSTALRLPLQRTGPDGTHHLIEPVLQLAWSGADDTVPNEDSVLVDFDEGNLFSLSRFPGDDRVEEGARADLGLSYTARLPDASRVGLTLGRVLRAEADDDFTPGTGLSGTQSDWLAAVDLEYRRFQVGLRTLADNSLDTTRAEAIAAYDGDRLDLGGSYLFLDAEPLENRPADTNEIDLNGNLRVSRHWRASAAGRFDLESEGLDNASFGLVYQTECIRVNLDAEKTFYPRLDIEPVTSYGFSVELLGFGAGSVDESYRSTCRG